VIKLPCAGRAELATELQRRAEATDEVFAAALTVVVRCSVFNAVSEPEEFIKVLDPDELSPWKRLVADVCRKCPRDKRVLCEVVRKHGYGRWATIDEEV